ncbi:hypothetical protein DKX38_029864 [Salix brachista]|uniref:Uncharacterized protein n=1 Tax=Salix brachista TaxID=2182728 RepID=A0A5N5J2E8_9ROSI|nr:hypothetical protein DKX38_029864 [Salix brachista]
MQQLCAALNINKRSVDRDLDVYRGLLSKLVQARELLKEYVDRERSISFLYHAICSLSVFLPDRFRLSASSFFICSIMHVMVFSEMIFNFREKKKQEERAESQKASETVAKCLGEPQFVGQ